MERTVTIGLIQMACTLDPKDNREKAFHLVRQCAEQGAQVICLQELFTTIYFCHVEDHKYFSLAEAIPGTTTQMFAPLAKELEVVLVLPFFERRAPGIYYNSAVVIDADGQQLGTYRKMHIPDDPGFYEKFYFSQGDLGFRAFSTRYGKIGVLICWDQWFPEAARLTAMHGAEILFYPTAIGWKPGHEEEAQRYHRAWQGSMVGHAIANGVHVAAVNRVGEENGLRFWGGSFIADTMGGIGVKADDSEQIMTYRVNLGEVERTRQEWPFFRDRRIDAFGGLLSRYLEGK